MIFADDHLRVYRSHVQPHLWFRVQAQFTDKSYYAKLLYDPGLDPTHRVVLMDTQNLHWTFYHPDGFIKEWFGGQMLASQTQWELSYEPEYMQFVLNEIFRNLRN